MKDGLYEVDTGKRIAIFCEGKNVVAMNMDGTKRAWWNYVARDYEKNLTCEVYEGKLYIAYLTINKEIIIKKLQNDISEVLHNTENDSDEILLKDDEVISKICYMKLVVLGSRIYLLFGVKASEGINIKYMHIVDKNKIYEINTISCGLSDKHIYVKNAFLEIFYGEKCEKILKISVGKDEQLKWESLFICNEKVIFEYENKIKKLKEKCDDEIEKMIKIKNEELENIVKSMENKWKGEYIKLEQLAIDIQNEGKKWRDKYYKSVKKYT